jgi:hypothetical protein
MQALRHDGVALRILAAHFEDHCDIDVRKSCEPRGFPDIFAPVLMCLPPCLLTSLLINYFLYVLPHLSSRFTIFVSFLPFSPNFFFFSLSSF